ncbi:terminase [Snodgrassella alvi]|nr:terminase [Snodgrassella alvi]
MGGLTDKQQRFVEEYLIDFNATQAAIRAGYSQKTAGSVGHENLRKPEIVAALNKAKQDRCERTQIDADYVLSRLVEIDQMDVADILNADGSVLPISQWPKVWRITLSGMDVLTMMDKEDGQSILKKIKWPDKVKNLELLGKHVTVRAFNDKPAVVMEQQEPTPVQIVVKAVDARVSDGDDQSST